MKEHNLNSKGSVCGSTDQWLANFYVRLRPKFISWVRRKYRLHDADAEDIFIDSYEVFQERIRNGSIQLDTLKCSPESFFYAIGKNKCLVLLRNKRKIAEIQPEEIVSLEMKEITFEIADENLEARVEMLKENMAKMPPKPRQILELYYHQGKSHKEIAKILKYANESTSRRVKHRALKYLRTLMSEAE